jgi:hypothetical protein
MIADTMNDLADLMEGSHKKIKVCLTIDGSEHGPLELLRGAELAERIYPNIRVILIGSHLSTSLPIVEVEDEKAAHGKMMQLLKDGTVDGAVTMHFNFPIGTSTVGRVIAPATGREMLIAATTGLSDSNRAVAMVKNAIAGIAVAKSLGIIEPSIGILNVDGAVQVEKALSDLGAQGYDLNWATSRRQDEGSLMRGNDVLMGTPDVLVCDSLSGNLLVKMMSAMTTGGNYEISGYGYGPGAGENFKECIGIISRASGAPLIANAIGYVGQMVMGGFIGNLCSQFTRANQCGLSQILTRFSKVDAVADLEVKVPPMKAPATADIKGIDILSMEDAVREVWKADIFASMGMGCTGPVIMVADSDKEKAISILQNKGFL